MSRRARRQGWWVLELLITTAAGFAAAALVAVAIGRDEWAARTAPGVGAVAALLVVLLLVRTRPRRWRAGRVS